MSKFLCWVQEEASQYHLNDDIITDLRKDVGDTPDRMMALKALSADEPYSVKDKTRIEAAIRLIVMLVSSKLSLGAKKVFLRDFIADHNDDGTAHKALEIAYNLLSDNE